MAGGHTRPPLPRQYVQRDAAGEPRVDAALGRGEPAVAVANTFTTRAELQPYIELGARHGYRTHVLIVERAHDGDNGHAVPDATIQRMAGRFQWLDARLRQATGGGRGGRPRGRDG